MKHHYPSRLGRQKEKKSQDKKRILKRNFLDNDKL